MKCPACFNNLSEKQVGSVKVDVCEHGCGGIWFDAFELQQVDEEGEDAGVALLGIRGGEPEPVTLGRKRQCPRCEGVKLYRRRFNPRVKVEVDECPGCGGYWLDRGELAQIRTLATAAKEPSPAAGAVVSTEVIRYLYRLRSEQA